MENFLGFGTCDSVYDGRRHIACLLTLYASYKLKINPNVINSVRSAIGIANYVQSHQLLMQSLYSADFYQFIESLGVRYNVSKQDLVYLSSGELFKLRITKTPAGYNRAKNIVLAVHFAYLQRYYHPLNTIVLQQLTQGFSFPILKGTSGGLTDAELHKIFSTVNMKLISGNTDLNSIESLVAKQI